MEKLVPISPGSDMVPVEVIDGLFIFSINPNKTVNYMAIGKNIYEITAQTNLLYRLSQQLLELVNPSNHPDTQKYYQMITALNKDPVLHEVTYVTTNSKRNESEKLATPCAFQNFKLIHKEIIFDGHNQSFAHSLTIILKHFPELSIDLSLAIRIVKEARDGKMHEELICSLTGLEINNNQNSKVSQDQYLEGVRLLIISSIQHYLSGFIENYYPQNYNPHENIRNQIQILRVPDHPQRVLLKELGLMKDDPRASGLILIRK